MVKPFALTIVAPGDLGVNVRSFGRHLGAENLSEGGGGTSLKGVRQFVALLEGQGMPPTVAGPQWGAQGASLSSEPKNAGSHRKYS